MNILLLFAVIGAFGWTVDCYDEKYDNVDIYQVLQNDRLLRNYIGCVLGDPNISCTPQGSMLQKYLPDAIQTDCKLCSVRQKIGAFKAIEYLMRKRSDYWDKIQHKFDPQNNFLHRNQRQLYYCKTHQDYFNDQEFLSLFYH